MAFPRPKLQTSRSGRQTAPAGQQLRIFLPALGPEVPVDLRPKGRFRPLGADYPACLLPNKSSLTARKPASWRWVVSVWCTCIAGLELHAIEPFTTAVLRLPLAAELCFACRPTKHAQTPRTPTTQGPGPCVANMAPLARIPTLAPRPCGPY